MIVVTGGAGFVGSNVVRGLNRRGVDDILVVDDLADGDKHRNLNSLAFQDLVDWRDFDGRLDAWDGAPIEAILHQGANADTTDTDGRAMLASNYECSKRLLAFALGRCPFVYASSAAVYGNGDDGFREEPRCEWPLNVYGFSKLLLDRWVRRILPEAPTPVVGLRYFNVYGPQENHKGRMASVVRKFHEQATAGGELRIFEGSDGFRRDFVFVDDVVDVNLYFLERADARGIYNVGTGVARSFGDLARATAAHYDGAGIAEIPFPDDLVGKYQGFTEADLSKLRAAGYTAEMTSLEDGVGAYVGVLQESGGWYRTGGTP